jgi:peptide/nickel transport system ATP-binding protein
MIFQEPMTSLNPLHTVERQIGEILEVHRGLSGEAARKRIIELLGKVGIHEPEKRLKSYPHQLSGGQRQRVMIAMALANEPDLLIADEPTTALDVTIQAQILQLLRDLQRENGMSIIFITHDFGVIAEICDRVVVMYGGRIIEQAEILELFDHPLHPYTRSLLEAIPKLETPPKSLLKTIPGMVPSLFELPRGCRFQNRCEYVEPRCRQQVPPLELMGDEHELRCFRAGEFS